MKVNIICPLYNASKYILNLDSSLKNQLNIDEIEITYVLTESKDNTEELLKNIEAKYIKIKKEEFSHSFSREMVAINSDSDILVFVTQDVVIKDNDWLEKLVAPIIDSEAEACFSKQICENNSIEKYTREANYPDNSYIVSKNDIERKGLKTFFFSDAASAIKTDIFKKLKGYDGKRLPINEDMYIAYKLIINGYKIKYCADSIVYHTHTFTLKQYYARYVLTGKFFKQNSYLDKYGTNKSGGNLAVYIFKRALQDRNFSVLIKFIPNMLARFVGMKIGKISK